MQVGHTMDLLKLLSAHDVFLPEQLASNFHKCFTVNYQEATGSFVELLFHAGGWTCYQFSSLNFPPYEEFKKLKQDGPLELNPLIFDRGQHFQNLFSSFIEHFVEVERYKLLYHEHFMTKVTGAFNLLVTGNWDSFRFIALILGTKLLGSLEKVYESLNIEMRFPENDESQPLVCFDPILCKKQDYLRLYWKQIFFRLHSNLHLCAHHSVGRFKQTGKTDSCSFHELQLWTVTTPLSPINDDTWLPTILQALRDKYNDNKWMAVMVDSKCVLRQWGFLLLLGSSYAHNLGVNVLYQLFNHQLIFAHQRKVFFYVKSDLLHLLKSRSGVAELCLRVFYCCIRYLDITLSSYEMESILHYLYDTSQMLSALAAQFVYHSHFVPLLHDPLAVIVHLVEINRVSFVKSEDLVVDSLYHLVSDHLKWSNWITVIKDAPDNDVADFSKMLSAFARKEATGFVPRIRTCKISQLMENSTSTSFTCSFINYWFELLEVGKMNGNPKAVANLLKIIQYFDSSLLRSVETVENLAQVCLAFLVITDDSDLIEEACHSLHYLERMTVDSRQNMLVVLKIIKAAILHFVSDFQNAKNDEFNPSFELVQQKVLSLAKYFDFNDNSLWWLVFNELRSLLLLKVELRSNLKTLETSMNFLFQLLMRKLTIASKEDSYVHNSISSNILVNCCLSQTTALRALLKYFLDSQYDNQIRKVAFRCLTDFLEFVGTHLSTRKQLWTFNLSLDEEEITVLISYVTETMELNKNCLHRLFEDAKLSNCCSIICKTCDLIALGLLDIHCLTPLLRCVGMCSTHDEIVMEALNRFSHNFPNRWELLAITILNAYLSLLDDATPAFPLAEDAPYQYIVSQLYMSFLNLTQYLVARNKFENKNIMKLMSTRLHFHMIEIALRPEGSRAVLELLYAVRDTLAIEDVDMVISFLQQYARDDGPDFTKYCNFMNQSVPKET